MSPLFPLIQSDLDLNGPILSFSTQPVGTSCSVASGIATFIGIATATFPPSQTERDTNTGTVTHQWYSGTTALTDGTTNGVTITGSATTTLTLSGLTNPLPISGQVFVQAGYDPNDLTPNAINEPINSDSVDLTVFPTISIDTQPVDTTVVEDIETTFSIAASTSDGSSGLEYQWILDGVDLVDGTSKTVIDIPKGSFSFASGDTICVRTSTAASAGNITAITDSTITDSNPGNTTGAFGIYRVYSGKKDWIKIEFASTQTGVTEIKLNGGGFVVGSLYDLYINDELVESGRTTVTLWSTDTISLNQSYDINSIRIEGSDGYVIGNLRFNGTTVAGTIGSCLLPGDTTEVTTVVSGSKTDTLNITTSEPALHKISCRVSHPTAQPSSVTSNIVNQDVATGRTFLMWELIGNGARQEKGERNLATSGGYSQRARVDINARIVQLFSPEKDIDVKITLGAAAGASNGNFRGGEGGISVFKMTLKQNTEYTVKLGVNSYQGGGPRGGIHGGGGLAVIYEKARVIAVCGGGGGAGTGGRGGDGGGCNVAGENGRSSTANGGAFIGVDQLPSRGMTQAGRTGDRDFDNGSSGSGRLSGCTIGGYYNDQGKAPCEDVGTGVAFLNNVGGVMSDTTSTSTGPITRGYKAGQGHRNNGGAGNGNGGGGGAGARGGEGTGGNGGGGGASGYYSSQVELLSSTTLPNGTRLGGNDDVAFICVEAYNSSLDGQQEPCIPPKSTSTIERTVEWTITRSTTENVSCVFTRETAPETGPTQLIFGPNAETKTSQISSGAVYKLTTRNNVDRLTIDRSVPQGILTLSDLDFNPGSLSITPSLGRFEVENVNNIQEATWTANW